MGFDWESAEIFAEGTAYNDKVRRALRWTLDWPDIDTGRAWWAAVELGVHAGEWSALPCGSATSPAERD
jgi:hypothetical protein